MPTKRNKQKPAPKNAKKVARPILFAYMSWETWNHWTTEIEKGKSVAAVAQVLLKWNLQNNWALITTSRNAERIEQSVDLFDFELTADEVEELRTAGAEAPLRKYWTKEMALPATSRI